MRLRSLKEVLAKGITLHVFIRDASGEISGYSEYDNRYDEKQIFEIEPLSADEMDVIVYG